MKKGGSTLFLRALAGEAAAIPPVWLMRQAGRYLPEYQRTRAEAGSFLQLCFDSERAAEVTLQPIRRFGFDAAIVFADILLIPHALGQSLRFVEGEGPRLDPPATHRDIEKFRARRGEDSLAPVYQTLRRTRAGLPPDTALIGFAGAPWTVATYMLAGGPARDPAALRARWYAERAFIDALIDLLIERTSAYLIAQIDAGADAVQLFDTWAGGMPEEATRALSLEPIRRIAETVKNARPGTPVIVFPKGVGAMARDYARLEACDAIGIDPATPWEWARAELSPHAVVQGGLDPLLLVSGGEAMLAAAGRLLRAFEGAPYVFNLGHGIAPQTPPDHVGALVDYVRGGSWRR